MCERGECLSRGKPNLALRPQALISVTELEDGVVRFELDEERNGDVRTCAVAVLLNFDCPNDLAAQKHVQWYACNCLELYCSIFLRFEGEEY